MPHYLWQRKDWTCFRWDAEALLPVLGRCRIRQGRLLGIIASLGMAQAREAQAELIVEEAVTTSAIEGEALSPLSVRSSVARRLGLPTAGLPNDRSADGLVSVLLDAAGHADDPLTVQRLHSWHAALFPTGYSGLHKIRVGRWRGESPMRIVSGPVGRERVHYEAPPASAVAGEMKHFVSWWNRDRKGSDGIIRAAVAHLRFVIVHPYEDGNGRIARVLTDMAIAGDDLQPFRYYSLSSQIMKERIDYYAALEKCSTGSGDITPWLSWFLGCFSRAIESSEGKVAVVLDKARFWQRHAHTSLSERQRKVMNRLIDSGRKGFEGGLTTRKYVALTNASRATAFREIEQLLQFGMLIRRPGGGRSASYTVKWDDSTA
ncbi:MAG: Fic family protein [Nitrospirae bacterium]|nr:Fic family protein [Nitrospirota bacterium]